MRKEKIRLSPYYRQNHRRNLRAIGIFRQQINNLLAIFQQRACADDVDSGVRDYYFGFFAVNICVEISWNTRAGQPGVEPSSTSVDSLVRFAGSFSSFSSSSLLLSSSLSSSLPADCIRAYLTGRCPQRIRQPRSGSCSWPWAASSTAQTTSSTLTTTTGHRIVPMKDTPYNRLRDKRKHLNS